MPPWPRRRPRAASASSCTTRRHYPPTQLASLVAGARAAVHPAVSEAAALPILDALAAGTPVVASAVGALPEVVGPAGLLVEPRDADRLAHALRAAWADDRVHRGIADGRGRAHRAGAAEMVGRRPGDAGRLRGGCGGQDRGIRRIRAGLTYGVGEGDGEGDGEGGTGADGSGVTDGDGVASLTGVPFTTLMGEPTGITCTNVWPTVSGTAFPAPSKNRVGLAADVFFQVPRTTIPFVAIQARPLPTLAASRRPFWPAPRDPKATSMTTTFFGRDHGSGRPVASGASR